MIYENAKLSDQVFTDGIGKAPTRDGFGKGSVEAGKKDDRVVVLSADLAESTRAEWFKKEFPERFIEVGVAEQNMATVAAGLANYGKIPFITSYAAFSPGRNYEQIRTTTALNDVPVKVCGMHAGISVGPDGATHQMLEDIALMRAMPNMTVIVPADAEEGRKATYAAAFTGKPAYLRFARDKTAVFTTPDTPFEIGKAYYLWKGEKPKVAIIGCGHLLYDALLAAKTLQEAGIQVSVINSHTIKPLDTGTILAAAKEAGAIVTVEEHQAAGGLGSAIAEFLSETHPVLMRFIAIKDRFGQSGEPSELMKEYGLTAEDIAQAVRDLANHEA
ncbi:MAG: transketolase family protein [Patescibacteria group bacterium]|nr:transketolase family protein [Patescibacteria group bacterium]